MHLSIYFSSISNCFNINFCFAVSAYFLLYLPTLFLVHSMFSSSDIIPGTVYALRFFFQFSAFQNTFYPLTDRFLYSLIKRFRKISQDAHPLLRIFYLYQHDGDTFFLNTSSIDKYNMPL